MPQTETSSHPVPDQRGANLFATDPGLQSLLPVYLPSELVTHLRPQLMRLGELAGGRLDELAQIADKHPPELQYRSRAGLDEQKVLKHPAYVEMERLAFSDYALAAISHRSDVLGWPGQLPATVKYALTYLFVQAEFGLCCPVSMTDSLTRTLKKFGAPELQYRSRTGWDEQKVLKHPAYVEMERLAFSEYALAAISHRSDVLGWQGQMPATVKYALTYLFVQAEFGLCCPVSMTDSLTRTLKKFGAPELVARYL
ncbi:MAG: hypothetical protein ACRECD_08085, partial [Burkholderiaceae bacterium]